MKPRIDEAALVRIVWLLVAFVLAGVGGGIVWWPASTQIAQVRQQAMDLYQRANVLDAQTRRAGELRAAQRRIEDDLRKLGGGTSSARTTAVALRLLSDEAKRNGLEFLEITPDTAGSPSTPAPAAIRSDSRLSGVNVSIRLRGPFRSLVALISDIPRHDVLFQVHDVQLHATGALRPLPLLDATLHGTIYHLVSSHQTENTHDRPV